MSMLAEPRQKTRYTLTPKGKPLFEESDRYGTKMLEKMGWSKGKGLGRGEDGNQEFVRVKYKRDGNGLGFESRDDQWTDHEKHFSGLLENLNGDNDSKMNTGPDDYEDITPNVGLGFVSKTSSKKKLKNKLSGQSLEEKSKNSKARVHYKKFTKGKDISQYSEKDLANIFGKKATPEDTNIYNQFQAFNANGSESDEKEEATNIINTGVSVHDYFKMKIAAMKEKQGLTSKNPFQSSTRNINGFEVFVPSEKSKFGDENEVTKPEEEEEEIPRKKKKNKKQFDEGEVAESGPTAAEESSEEKNTRKKKKSKKPVESSEEQSESMKQQDEETNQDQTMEPVSISKKKIKKLPDEQPEQTPESKSKEEFIPFDDTKESDNQQKKKKNKSKKRPREELGNEEELETACVLVEDQIPKKKKKDKKNSVEEIESKQEGSEESFVPIKKKKSKKSPEDQPEVSENSVPVQEEEAHQVLPDAEVKPSIELTKEENIKPTKKSKKKKNKSITPPTSSTQEEEVSSHHTNLNSLTDLNNFLLDTYTISTFCAEKFRNVELDKYKGSNLMDLTGYGLREDIQLDVQKINSDAERILRLWNGTLDKYTHSTPTRKLYSSYRKKLIRAKKARTAIPKLKFKTLKRKHVFQCM